MTRDQGEGPAISEGVDKLKAIGRAAEQEGVDKLESIGRAAEEQVSDQIQELGRAADEQLRTIQRRYAQLLQGSNTRIADIIERARSQAPVTREGSFTADAVIAAREDVALTGELIREQGEATRAAIEALANIMRVSASEAAKSANSLVWWTRIIGVATLLALAAAIYALSRT